MGGHSGGGGRAGRGGSGGSVSNISPETQALLDSWPNKNVAPATATEVLAFANSQKTFGNRFIDAATDKFGISDGFADHVAKYVREERKKNAVDTTTAKERSVRSILAATKGQRFGGNKSLGNR